jgi:hypothetical protein
VIKMIAGGSILEFLLRVRRRRELRVIGASTLFDRGWYLRQYPDVRKAGIDEVMH